MSTRRSIEKDRMRFVFEFVKNNGLDKQSDAKKFEAYVQKVPAFIMTNGLGNTLAYLITQKDKQWENVQRAICQWMTKVENPLKSRIGSSNEKLEDILQVLKDDDFSDREYRAVTVEILALFNWLRRLAKAHRLSLKSKKQGNG